MKTTVVLLGLLALVGSQTTPVNQCLYNSGVLPLNTYIENCPTPPCQLPQLQDVVIHIIFQAPYKMHSMRTLATAYIFGPVGIGYDLEENAVTCNFITNTNCPVFENEVVQYTLKMHIESWFPVGTQVTIEFRIVDESGIPVVCLRVPVAITLPLAGKDNIGLTASNRTLFINAANYRN